MITSLLNRFARPLAAILCSLALPAAALGQAETGPVARFTTSAGTITFTLFDSKPIATTNFINIITAHNYDNVILNRNPQDFVIQGGGFFAPNAVNGAPIATPAVAPITGEPGVSNIRGTLAMALSNGPNTGTKEFFFNLTDNSFLDAAPSGGPFTVFGRVRGVADQNVLDTINSLPKFNICSQLVPAQNCSGNPQNLPFGSVPLQGYAGTPTPVAITNYVTIQVAEVSPQIRTQPVAQAIFANQTANFSVAAVGTGTLSYQWRRNGVNLSNGGGITGATSPNLSIANAQVANAGSYDCLVSNNVTTELAIAAAASTAVALTVNAPPTINTHPSPVSVTAGGNAQFTVAASGAGTLTYQWRKGTTNLINGGIVSGATTPTLTLTGVATGDAGNYNCVVTNAAGSSTSNDAALTVNVAPAATTQPQNATVTQGQTAQFTAAFSGTPAPTLQWFKGAPGSGTIVNGQTSGTLSIANAQPSDAGSYYCAATNVVSTVNSNAATLTVNVPAGVTNPSNATVNAGQTAMFSVVASGSPAPTLQWRKGTTNLTNGGNISGATTATLTISNTTAADAGNYNCVATNVAGSATSADATLAVNVGPAITSHPANAVVVTGGTAQFTVAASGTPTLTYQWRKGTTNLTNGGNISGATSTTLSLTNVSAGDAGSYNCVVTNAVSSATSNSASLTVTSSPVITTQPATNGIAIGGGATLTVAATGTAPLTYQWQRNGAPIANGTTAGGSTVSGATTSALVLSNFAAGDVDPVAFRCVVTNASGTATSNAVTFVVVAAPMITTQPVDRSVVLGGSATFNVVASGGGTLVYKWRKNGIMLTDGSGISGSQTASLTINPVAQSHFGAYDVVVSNGAGQASSVVVNLIQLTAPTITTHPVSATKDPNQSVTFTVAASGSNPLSYQWRKGTTNLTNGGRFSGATGSSLTITGLVAGDAGDYSCVVTNSVGNATSNAATLTINTAPSFTTQPANATVNQGVAASFTVAATGPGTITYQWRRNGTPLADGATGNGSTISGATTTTLTITNTAGADANTYDCIATNSVGSTTSNTVTLTVNTAPAITQQPQPQSVVVGGTANFSVTATGANLTYRWRRNGVNLSNGARISGATSANLSISSLVAGDAGNYSVVVTGSISPAVTSSAAALTVITIPTITTHPQSITLDPQSTANFSVVASGSGLTYQWRKDGNPLSNGSGVSGATAAGLTITNVLFGVNDGQYDCVVTNLAGSVTTNAATLTVRDIPYFTTHPSNVPTGVAGQPASFTVVAMGGAPITYQWYKGTPQSNTPVVNGGHISGADTATLSFNPIAGNGSMSSADAGTYFCIATNPQGTRTSNSAALTVFFPPFISAQDPLGVPTYIVTGASKTFSVTAGGSPTLSYQWYRGDAVPRGGIPSGVPIDGATNPSYTLTNAQAFDNTFFFCRVTNTYGQADSAHVQLFVGDPPAVVSVGYTNPVTIVSPNSAQLAITGVNGTAPISYQWRRNGQNLTNTFPRSGSGTTYSGVTTSTLSIGTAHLDAGGTYDCVVSSPYGSTTDGTSTVVNVYIAPSFTQHPATKSVPQGQPTTLSVAIDPNTNGTITYQWFFDGDPIDAMNPAFSGAHSATLTINTVNPGTSDPFACRVSQAETGIQITSNSATITGGVPPSITSQPPATSDLAIGGGTTLNIDASGDPTLTYQWFKDGNPLSEDCPGMGGPPRFCGTQTPSLTISVAQTGDSGLYHCVATNDFGQAASDTTDLAVVFPPVIGVQPGTTCAYFGQSMSLTVGGLAGGRLSFRWQRSENNADYFDMDDGVLPCPSFYGSGCVSSTVVSGAHTATLTFTTADYISNTYYYRCIVSNAAGTATSDLAFAHICNSPFVITQPANSDALNGAVATFTAEFNSEGPGPITAKWFHNDVEITDGDGGRIQNFSGTLTQTGPNTFSATLTINNVQDADVGDYFCQATDPSNQSTITNQASLRTPRLPVVHFANNYPALLPTGTGFYPYIDFSGSGPFTVEWRKDGNVITTDGHLSIVGPAQNYPGHLYTQVQIGSSLVTDSGVYDVRLCNPAGCVLTTFTSVTFGDPPVNDGIAGDLTIALGGTLDLTQLLDAGTGPFTYQWYKGTAADPALANDGRITGADTAHLVITGITPDDAGQYTCHVMSDFGAFDASVTVTVGNPPVIDDFGLTITNPVAGKVPNGGTFTAGVDASGDPTLTYQWRREGVALMNSPDISGATSPSLTVSNAGFNTGGNYTCEVTNDFGSAVAGPINVVVQGVAPNITMQPQGLIRPLNGSAAFSVAATGDPAPTYRWATFQGPNFTLLSDGDTADGTTIAGATTAMLQLTNLHLSDFTDQYFCFVTNPEGEVLSDKVSLTQLSAPSYLLHPQSQTVNQGDSVTFTARIDGALQADNPFTFKWFSGLLGSGSTEVMSGPDVQQGIDPMDAYTIFLTVSNVQPTTPLTYYFINVSNGGGNATGSFATLTVTPSTPPCRLDYTPDGSVNSDDLGDFITDYFTDPAPSGPGGYATLCPENDPPYDAGYRAAFTLDGSPQCFQPNSDNLGDFITEYFNPDNHCGNNG